MTPRELQVWWDARLVGTLSQQDGRLGFVYAAPWLESATARPLSMSLPLRAEIFDDRAARPFFAGLLPEGAMRASIARMLHISARNDFALLDRLGGECAGAVTLLEPGQTPAEEATFTRDGGEGGEEGERVRWLDDAALLQLMEELPRRPLLAGEAGVRLSLAGAQDKLPVVVWEGRIGLPLHGTASTHILKPAIAGVEGSVCNEWFCMTLAARLKLHTAAVQVHRVAGRALLLVTRYDRQRLANGTIHRLHQEDFCQALGVPPEYKYQNEGGPDAAQCFSLLRQATRPSAPHLLALLDAMLFNALLGNHDAHAKNFSLLYAAQGAVLAPLYDVLCTAVYPELTDRMAMKIGGRYVFEDVMPRHWERFATASGLSAAQLKKRLATLAARLPVLAETLVAETIQQGETHAILTPILEELHRRCALTRARLERGA
ncbi:type II toxin-antitoxin system HipA family toxin [Megalodesulfovibrio gigas]|uniref:Putative HipA N-terminal domain-containing protein n=1 Tax=Megalodesulfovibrio gigas (strain ATCC 19364 / DSM 1382 / NCIMB 9332 / VKM B-1759) TaxID=1121448 RepID=T2GFU2_MEGG1|nr:type II toxin-antitoxin system HipA family toxin [Megalodesulfovibrio gigas]AGW15031.1 putative HipA N-terminal domain-containing protein [Megalodesulfovibrio gigas DSM 1382 = ATCC 19364]